MRIDSLKMTYQLGSDGMIDSLSEDYLLKYYDGNHSFDIQLNLKTVFSNFGEEFQITIPELAVEVTE